MKKTKLGFTGSYITYIYFNSNDINFFFREMTSTIEECFKVKFEEVFQKYYNDQSIVSLSFMKIISLYSKYKKKISLDT